MLKKSSPPLKLLGQMEPNLAGSIYVRCSIKFLYLVPFGQQTWPLLLKIEHGMGRNEEFYRGPYIDAFCQVWFHLAQLFQRSRLKYEKLTDGRRTPSDGNTSHLCKILYKTSSFNSIRPTNMAAVTKNRTYGKIAHFW
jgi:hypothetical protein